MLRENAYDLRAMAQSQDAFPGPARDEVGSLQPPTLMLSGGRTIPVHRVIDAGLSKLLPRCARVTIADAGHDMWGEQPDECRQRTWEFIRSC